MKERDDNLRREFHRLDPVRPGELEGSADSAEAAELLDRILATEPGERAGAEPQAEPGRQAEPAGARRRRLPRPAFLAAGAGAPAAAAIILFLVLGLTSGGSGGDELTAALDRVAATAGAQSPAGDAQPYTYLKTREMSVSTDAADRRSWRVLRSTTREEWVTRDGAGRLRVVDGPSRFIDAADRAEWEGAGEPTFLALGFGRRTEDRFVDAGMLRGGVEELPTDPATLAARLRAKAEVEHGETPIDAATLQLIAEDLRDPGVSPARRQALFEAAEQIPGIEYLGPKTDPAGRRGVAVGVSGSLAGAPTVYSMIFDPRTSEVLATVATTPAAGAKGGPIMLRARVYLQSRGIGSLTGKEGGWLSGFDPSRAPSTTNLVYRIPLGSS
jgi:hypothetical protein